MRNDDCWPRCGGRCSTWAADPDAWSWRCAQLGIAALGVDASPQAVTRARARGAATLERSVFDALPGEGRWPTVLLFDGNVGIGGDPIALLGRVADLLSPTGRAMVEVEPPGAPSHAAEARLERGAEVSIWFPWAWVGADGIDDVADQAGLAARRVAGGRRPLVRRARPVAP